MCENNDGGVFDCDDGFERDDGFECDRDFDLDFDRDLALGIENRTDLEVSCLML